MIIAIDGPAGSGKSTVAREVAKRLGMRYSDTGAMYRTITLLALEAGLVPERIGDVGALAAGTLIRFEERPDDLARVFVGEREVSHDIRGRAVSQAVSAVSADPGVRAVLTDRQRAEAAADNVVLEGRDMGTVVVPSADLKVFLTASIEERAKRRQLQLSAQGASESLNQLVTDIAARDNYDSGRQLAPLRKADDAVEIDTTEMTIEEVVDTVCAYADAIRSPMAVDAVTPCPARQRHVRKWPFSRMIRSPLDTLLYRIAFAFIPPLWRLLFRMQISGRENLPTSGAVVVASNHRSNLDPFFLGVSTPRQIHFMAKAELWKFKSFGRLLDMLGAFPISRGEADRRAVKRALEVLEAGALLGIFPEGRRERESQLGEIHPGATSFSLREGVVTVPVVLVGTDRVVRGRIPRFPRVQVVFGPRLEVPGADVPRSERTRAATDRLVAAFHELLASTTERR